MTHPLPGPPERVIVVGQVHVGIEFKVTRKLLRLSNRDFHRAERELLRQIGAPEQGFAPFFLDWAGFPLPLSFGEPDPDARAILRDQLRRVNDVRARAGKPALRLGAEEIPDERLRLECRVYNRTHKCTHRYPLLLDGPGTGGFLDFETATPGVNRDGQPEQVRVRARAHLGLSFAQYHPLDGDPR